MTRSSSLLSFLNVLQDEFRSLFWRELRWNMVPEQPRSPFNATKKE